MYKTSDERLKEFVKERNKHKLKFAIQLGDLIDKDYESYEPILKILEDLKTPLYNVLGNHDFSVAPHPKSAVLKLLKMPKKYYSIKVNNYRFIALDDNNLSFHVYEKDSQKYLEAEKYYRQNKVKSPKWNGALSQTQMNWLG
ncbi:MAG: metallophosphoesterase [Lentisphaerales bacterium]|nr:metallophosphoesterase [Lentisphaerales bacterium]